MGQLQLAVAALGRAAEWAGAPAEAKADLAARTAKLSALLASASKDNDKVYCEKVPCLM